MVKAVKVRGLNCGDAARFSVKQGYAKDVKQEHKNLRQKTCRDNQTFRTKHCFHVKLPLLEPPGNTFDTVCISFHTLFGTMAAAAPEFGRLLFSTSSNGVIPLILYADEITPGNPLQPDPSRKCWLFYAAPACQHPTRDEQTWGIFASIRLQTVKQVKGGLAAVWHALLGELLNQNTPKLLAVSGLQEIVTYSIQAIIADEAALHGLLACKGAAGRKPCFKCSSIVSKACWEQLGGASERLQPLHHPSLRDVMQSSDDAIWQAIDYLVTLKDQITKKDFGDYEKSLGWHGVTHTVQADPVLRLCLPPSKHIFDPLHCYFSAGIVGIELALLKETLHEKDILWSWVVEKTRATAMSFRGYHKPNLAGLTEVYFSDQQWKANASTQMGLWPLLHVTLEKVLTAEQKDSLQPCLSSFFALCRELKQISILKHSSKPDGLPILKQVQSTHQRLFLESYGAAAFRPKHHFRLHLPDIFQACGFLYDCVTMERKHRMAKAEIQGRLSALKAIDTTLLPRLHQLQLEELERYQLGTTIKSSAEAKVGSLCLKIRMPILFLESNLLFWPQQWIGLTPNQVLVATGDVYHFQKRATANLILWRLAETQVRKQIEGFWMLPLYWSARGPTTVETIH